MTRGDAPRALIIGGSMAGLAAALFLRRRGWRADVYERSTDGLSSRGAGILTHPELLAALDECGAGSEGVGVPIRGRVTFDADGATVGAHDLPQIASSWDALYRRMRAALPDSCVHPGRALARLERRGGGVTAIFADGGRAGGDLLLGCDGVRSTVRAQLAPCARPLYAGYVAWRGMVAESRAGAATRAALAGRLSFCLPPGEQFLSYAIAGEDGRREAGDRRLNWVWYRPAPSGGAFEIMFTDSEGARRDVSMPPGAVRREVAEAMRADSRALLPPAYRELIALTAEPFLQAIYDLESTEIAFGRAALLGDAAFVARPHTGFGVTKAVGDAAALAHALEAHDGDIDAAVALWRAGRLSFGRDMVARGRVLGRLLDMGRAGEEIDPFGRLRHASAAVMAETGISGAMRGAGAETRANP